jgi:hypothetical protein
LRLASRITPRFLTDADEMITFSPRLILDAGTAAFSAEIVSESVFATFRDSLFSTVQP